jgi:diphthamide biosynthesis methyltransferase
MLWLIGLGIEGLWGMNMKGLEVLKTCNLIYIERFTGYLSDIDLSELTLYCKRDDNVVNIVGRSFVEDAVTYLNKPVTMRWL